MKTKKSVVPKPVLSAQRICFGISWFKTEEDAQKYHEEVQKDGRTYNGGFFHGMPCGRDTGFDFVHKEHGQLYAVTD